VVKEAVTHEIQALEQALSDLELRTGPLDPDGSAFKYKVQQIHSVLISDSYHTEDAVDWVELCNICAAAAGCRSRPQHRGNGTGMATLPPVGTLGAAPGGCQA
jgi:hypothetical protein